MEKYTFLFNDQIQKYGLSLKVRNDIHIENNCNGKMILYDTKYKTCSCSTCENWRGCGRDSWTIYYYRCEKCKYQY